MGLGDKLNKSTEGRENGEKTDFLNKLFLGMFDHDEKKIDQIIAEGKQSKVFSDLELDEYGKRVKAYLPTHRIYVHGSGHFDTETNVEIAKMNNFKRASLEKYK